MTRMIYEDYCKEFQLTPNDQDYGYFMAGWYACRGAILSVVESLTDEENETAH